MRSAYLQAQSSKLLTEAAERLVESTRLSSEAAQEGFELGVVTNVDVLNALRDQFQAERDLQRARYEQINYLLLLKREAGTLNAGGDGMLEIARLMVAPDSLIRLRASLRLTCKQKSSCRIHWYRSIICGGSFL